MATAFSTNQPTLMRTTGNIISKLTFIGIILSLSFAMSCGDDDGAGAGPIQIQAFDIDLSSSNSIPTVSGRNETGNTTMNLFDDNSLEFTITINNLSSTDQLNAAHVHSGDPVSAGGVEIPLVDGTDITFSGNTASGTITLTADQISTLLGSDVYVNVHSTEIPSGLVRGQIDKSIDNAYNVALSPSNAVPPIVGRSEEGNAHFRLVGSTMYFKVSMSNLDPSDAIIAGHIHEGSSTENGGVLISLDITDEAQLGVTKSVTLSSDELAKMNNDELYVNIHSTDQPSGLLRGQIR